MSRLLACLLVASALSATDWDFTTIQVGSGFDKPVAVVAAPGVTSHLFVIEQHTGKIRLLDPVTGTIAATPFLTVSGVTTAQEQGLLGLAFHPQYATNGRLFVNCTRAGHSPGGSGSPGGGHTEILRYTAVGDPVTATTAGSETLVLAFDQPETNHNGGWMGFGPGPSPKLFIASGDGGGGNDGHGTIGSGQDRTTLLGKLLRLDVDGASLIPSDNPYAGHGTYRGEIWCFGLRNPWRCSIDRLTGDVWIGDVGQGAREEVDVVPVGVKNLNFGWRPREGTIATPGISETPVTTATEPVAEYGSPRTAVVGGYVYRGSAMPWLQGTYIYADYGNSDFFALTYDVDSATMISAPEEVTDELNPDDDYAGVSSLGEDNAGELYIVSYGDGTIYKIIPASPTVTTTSPLPESSINRPYAKGLNATGGTGTKVWTIESGALPTGLSLSSGGSITGTPTVSGTFTFTVKVTAGGSGTKAMSLTINAAPNITTASPLPQATVGSAYSRTIAVSGGTTPLTFTISAGSLPGGLSLSSAGVISGTPGATGTATFTVTVTDDAGATDAQAYSLTVNSAPLAPTITSTPVTRVRVSGAYIYDVNASGNPAPTFSLVSPPSGMTINASSGVISWTPGATGDYAVQVVADNGVSPDDTQSFIIDVHDHGLTTRPAASAYLGMPSTSGAAKPAHLSGTGTFSDTSALTPASALIPYGVNAPFWSDGATKTRWISVPTGAEVDFAPTREWAFPDGTVFVKHFTIDLDDGPATDLRRLETRILVRQSGGGVYGVTYRWNGGDADRVDATQTETLTIATSGGGTRTQTWTYPSPGDCLQCHTAVSGGVLGVNTRQLNGTFAYGAGSDNQLATWGYIGLLDSAPSDGAIAAYRKLVAANDTSASLEHRARSYLDANCAQCHRPGGAPTAFDARYDTPFADQHLINGAVTNDLGISGAKVVVPGDVARSILHRRVNTDDPTIRMPPLGRATIDTQGEAMLAAWIGAMPPDGGVGGGGANDEDDDSRCGLGTGIAALFLLLTWSAFARPRRRR